MHQHLAAEIVAELDQPQHHVDGAPAHRLVGTRDRESARRQQQPMQSRDVDSRLARRPAYRGTFRGDHEMRLVGEREGRELHAVVAHRLGELALSRERHRLQDLVTQGDFHWAIFMERPSWSDLHGATFMATFMATFVRMIFNRSVKSLQRDEGRR